MAIGSRTAYSDMVREAPNDFRIHTRVYTDPQVFNDEMERIFERTWVYVGHESEIPQPGDYKTAAIGRLPVIVSRGPDRRIHVLLNTCRHRGSIVCREERGHSNFFRCPYHSWVYFCDGTLQSISERQGYPEDWGQDIGGLVKAPRVATYREMIFASFAPEGESLETTLGPAKQYVDFWFDKSPTGRVRLLTPHRTYYPANWKFQLENTTDGWHAKYVHESAFSTLEHFGRRNPGRTWDGSTRGFDHGHNILARPLRTKLPPELAQEYLSLLIEAHGAERAEQIHYGWHLTLFPNLHLMEYKFRVVQPVAVDKTLVYEYPVALDGVPDRLNHALKSRLESEGSLASGFVNSDDVEIFTRVQSGLYGARKMEWFLLSRGMHREVVEPSGERVGHDSDETPQRAIYREWARLMSAD